jgi:DNA helicase-2/ATP-dependent DNA helicase PcrA
VGLTRARKRAFVSWATSRRVHNTWQSSIASRFIGELPADAIELSEPGRANGRRDLFERPAAWRETAFERHRGPTLDIAPDGVQVRPLRAVRFKLGERVFHQKFGMGTVDGIDGDRLTIAFDKAGEKTVLAGFVAPLSAS